MDEVLKMYVKANLDVLVINSIAAIISLDLSLTVTIVATKETEAQG